MDTLPRLPTRGDGFLDMRELARTLPGTMVNEVMDAQADMTCEDGVTARNGYRERGLATVSVNVFFTVFANVLAPIPPTHIHRLRQRTFTTSG